MKENPNFTHESLNNLLRKESTNAIGLRVAGLLDLWKLVPIVNNAYLYENVGENAFKRENDLRTNRNNMERAMTEGTVVVSIANGQLAGCFEYREIPKSEGSTSTQEINAYFGMLAVSPNFQRRRIGSKMVNVAEEIGRISGKEMMEIQVVNHSKHLIDLYTKLGYKEFGTRDWNMPFLTKPAHFILMEKSL